ncbi:MAG: DUF6941 family protein [Oligoflexia bacterium]|jgi:hypothetical protein
MALKLSFASLSLGAAVDQQTGSLSVFDIVDEIRTPQVPIHLQSLVISLALENTRQQESQGKVLIHLLTPDGKQNLLGQGELNVPREQRRLKAVFRFGGFPVFHFGSHRFVVSWVDAAGTKQGEALLDFEAVQVTQVAQGVPPAGGEKPPLSH